jgi:hypothetical protein
LPALIEEKAQSTYNKLVDLLRRDLDFGSSDSVYVSHGVHPFAAKFPPQIPHLFIEELTEVGDSMLDSMLTSDSIVR